MPTFVIHWGFCFPEIFKYIFVFSIIPSPGEIKKNFLPESAITLPIKDQI